MNKYKLIEVKSKLIRLKYERTKQEIVWRACVSHHCPGCTTVWSGRDVGLLASVGFSVGVFVATLAITLYLMENDPKLLERRVKAGPAAEKEKLQKVIQSLASLTFIALFIVSAADHRFGWSAMPTYAIIAGDVLVALGLFVVFLVFKENTYTSATIEVGADQKIITTGPYAIVRHPMYAGSLIMLFGVPLALGSWLGLLVVILCCW